MEIPLSKRESTRGGESAKDNARRPTTASVPRLVNRLNDAAKRTMGETQNRLVVAMLRSYFKSFIVNFDPKMIRVESTLRGLTLSFLDTLELNCAALNSLGLPFWPESLMVTRCTVKNMVFTAGLAAGLSQGLTFTSAALAMPVMEVIVVAPGRAAPRLPASLEARLLEEWYGPAVNASGMSSRMLDGLDLALDSLVVTLPGSAVVTVTGLRSVSVDVSGEPVGLQQCWEAPGEEASQGSSGRALRPGERGVRKRVDTAAVAVDLLAVAPDGSEGLSGCNGYDGESSGDVVAVVVDDDDDDDDDDGSSGSGGDDGSDRDPTAPPPVVRAPFLREAAVGCNAFLAKDAASGGWLDLALRFDRPTGLAFALGSLPVSVQFGGGAGDSGGGLSGGARAQVSEATSSSAAAAKARAAGGLVPPASPAPAGAGGARGRCGWGWWRRRPRAPAARSAAATKAATAGGRAPALATTPANDTTVWGRAAEQAAEQAAWRTSHVVEGFVCPGCLATFGSAAELTSHFEASHGGISGGGGGGGGGGDDGSASRGERPVRSTLGELEASLVDLEGGGVPGPLLAALAEGLDLILDGGGGGSGSDDDDDNDNDDGGGGGGKDDGYGDDASDNVDGDGDGSGGSGGFGTGPRQDGLRSLLADLEAHAATARAQARKVRSDDKHCLCTCLPLFRATKQTIL